MDFASDKPCPEAVKKALEALCRLEATGEQALSAIAWITWRGRFGASWNLAPKSGSDGLAWSALAFMAQASADELIGPLELEWGPMGQKEYAERARRQSGGLANPCAEIPLEPVLDWFGSGPAEHHVRRSNVIARLSQFIATHALPLVPEPAARVREPLALFIERVGRHAPEPSEQTQRMLRDAFLPSIEEWILQEEARAGEPAGRAFRI